MVSGLCHMKTFAEAVAALIEVMELLHVAVVEHVIGFFFNVVVGEKADQFFA